MLVQPSVQDGFTAYLDERGINHTLATVVIDMQAHKEQQEYVGWVRRSDRGT